MTITISFDASKCKSATKSELTRTTTPALMPFFTIKTINVNRNIDIILHWYILHRNSIYFQFFFILRWQWAPQIWFQFILSSNTSRNTQPISEHNSIANKCTSNAVSMQYQSNVYTTKTFLKMNALCWWPQLFIFVKAIILMETVSFMGTISSGTIVRTNVWFALMCSIHLREEMKEKINEIERKTQ